MPAPTVVVSCCDSAGRPNAITLGAAGVACANPPLLSAAISPNRYSHGLICATGDFVVNVPRADQADLADKCGCVSGRDGDKLAELGLSATPARRVRSPLIAEFPVSYECKLFRVISCGSHDLFLGEVQCVHVDEGLLAEDEETIDPCKFDALVSLQTSYFHMGDCVGRWFFTREERRE